MNFLSSCCARSGGIKFWTTPCFRGDLKPLQVLALDETTRTKHPCHIRNLERLSTKLCTQNFRVSFGPTTWTQVRFNKCPRLHRDIEFPNFDVYRKTQFKDVRKTKWGSGDEKAGYIYVIGLIGFLAGAYGTKAHMIHYISYMAAAADVLALASIEVDVSNVKPGTCLSVKWRGKPLFIKYRTEADIALEEKTPLSALRDPQTQEQRTIKKNWLVVIGICTHLGCVPVPNSGDWAGGFLCPCHGSHFDNLGRARKGPAPSNLEVPPYIFLTDTLVRVG